jgi:curli biogenesis system outer membrane secretion channel CsgG
MNSVLRPLWACGAVLALSASLVGCATEASRSVEVQPSAIAAQPYNGPRYPLSIGKFDNRSNYMRGVFSDGVDRLGSQAKTILISHLQQTQRFNVLDRDNLQALKQESGFQGSAPAAIKAAHYVVTGDVTEFGRKEVGDQQFFGVLGRGKQQIAYAKVTLNVVKAATAEVVFSSQGAAEYSLSNREIVGFGGTASYDSTLNGKVLDLAIREAVEKLAKGVQAGAWNPGGAQ